MNNKPTSTNQKWFCTIDEKSLGPISSRQLKQLADSGRLKPSDAVWTEGKSRRPASKVKGLFSVQAPPQKTPMPVVADDTNQTVIEKPEPKAKQLEGLPTQKAPTFFAWYKEKWVSKLRWFFQLPIWLVYGFVWIPVWYFFSTTTGGLKSRWTMLPFTGKAACCLPFVLLATFAFWNPFSGSSSNGNDSLPWSAESSEALTSDDDETILVDAEKQPPNSNGLIVSVTNVVGTKFAFASDSRSILAMTRDNSRQTLPVVFDLNRGAQLVASITNDDIRSLASNNGGALGAELDLAGAISFRAELVSNPDKAKEIRGLLLGYPVSNRMCPNGPLLVSVGLDNPLTVKNVQTGKPVVELASLESGTTFMEGISSVHFSKDQNWMSVFGLYGESAIWNLKNGKVVWASDKHHEARGFTNQSKYFAFIERTKNLSVIDVESASRKTCSVKFPYGSSFGGFSSDGSKFLVVHQKNQPTIVVVDSSNGNAVHEFEVATLKRAKFIGETHVACWESNPDRCVVRELSSGNSVKEVAFNSEQSPVRALLVSDSGRFVATLHDNSTLHVWDFTKANGSSISGKKSGESKIDLSNTPTTGERLHLVAMGAITFASQQDHPINPTEFNGYMQSFARSLNAQELMDIKPTSERERYQNGEKLLYVKYGDGDPRIEFGFIEKKGGWVLIKGWLGDREWNPLTGFSK